MVIIIFFFTSLQHILHKIETWACQSCRCAIWLLLNLYAEKPLFIAEFFPHYPLFSLINLIFLILASCLCLNLVHNPISHLFLPVTSLSGGQFSFLSVLFYPDLDRLRSLPHHLNVSANADWLLISKYDDRLYKFLVHYVGFAHAVSQLRV